MGEHTVSKEISLGELQEFIAAFWHYYDEWNAEEIAARFADNIQYTGRSDTGASPFEDMLRADLRGRDETMAWLTEHRNQSPYPLRHNSTNIFRTGRDGDVTNARCYIFVTVVSNLVPVAASSGIVDFAVIRGPVGLQFTSLDVVLDTQESAILSSLSAADGVARSPVDRR